MTCNICKKKKRKKKRSKVFTFNQFYKLGRTSSFFFFFFFLFWYYKLFWHSKATPRHAFILWLASLERLPKKDVLYKHGVLLTCLLFSVVPKKKTPITTSFSSIHFILPIGTSFNIYYACCQRYMEPGPPCVTPQLLTSFFCSSFHAALLWLTLRIAIEL